MAGRLQMSMACRSFVQQAWRVVAHKALPDNLCSVTVLFDLHPGRVYWHVVDAFGGSTPTPWHLNLATASAGLISWLSALLFALVTLGAIDARFPPNPKLISDMIDADVHVKKVEGDDHQWFCRAPSCQSEQAWQII